MSVHPLRRVVVTGIGLVTPLGATVAASWKNLVNARSGIVSLQGRENGIFDDMPCTVAGLVPLGKNREDGELNVDNVIGKDRSKTSIFMLYALVATQEALEDANWFPQNAKLREQTGVSIGSSIGSLQDIYSTSLAFADSGIRRVSPFFYPRMLVNMAAGAVSLKYGFMGPNHTSSTACTTGAHSIGDAFRMIQLGDADVMVAGASEAGICPIGIAGFAKARALNTKYNHDPPSSSRPFDRDRSGFVMGEGAGILILEEYTHAKSRNAKIYAELCGYGMSGDAYHITAPRPDGRGAQLCMARALEVALLQPEKVDYINAHATGTELGDVAESQAIKAVFESHAATLNVSSTKSSTGHLLGAAGAVESIFSILAVHHDIIPPTVNLNCPDVEAGLDLNYTPLKSVGKSVNVAVSNSFGFGGVNASLVVKKVGYE